MKKLSVLVVICMVFAIFGCVAAQDAAPVLPALDEAAAADFLGTWYLDSVSVDDEGFHFDDLGVVYVLEINADNTMVSYIESTADETTVQYWYMEDGNAFQYNADGDPVAMTIDEDGCLCIEDETGVTFYSREIEPLAGTGEFVADAAVEDFYGTWYLNSILSGEFALPTNLIGMDGVLVIEEGSLDLTVMDDAEEDLAYEFSEGRIYFEEDITDENGEPTGEKTPIVLELRDEGQSIVMTVTAAGSEAEMVFLPEENLSDDDLGDFLVALLGKAIDSLGE